MCLKIELLLKGQANYSRLYDEEVSIITSHDSTNTSVHGNFSDPGTPTTKDLIIKCMFLQKDKILRLVSGKKFNKIGLSTPSKKNLPTKLQGVI